MQNLTETTTQKIVDFLNNLKTDVCITDYIDLSDIEFDDAYNSIYEKVQENGGFNIDVIYYSEAINYLRENDPSLKESLEIASDFGYELKNLSSEVLASLLASQNAVNDFAELEDEINNFFTDLQDEITELEQD